MTGIGWEWGQVPSRRHALAERRRTMGHSQEALAHLLGVEPTTVGRWERGSSRPQPWIRPALAGALAVTVEELDGLLGDPAPGHRNATPPAADEETVLSAPWNHAGTVEAAVALRGGGPVQRRQFLFLTGATLTAPAHHWLIHEPGPLHSGLTGHRISTTLTNRLPTMISELRTLDDLTGGGTVLTLAQADFDWVTGLLHNASYDEPTAHALHTALAELGQLAGWAAYDAGRPELAQRYNIAALRAAHSADDRPLGSHVLGSMAKQAAHQGRGRDAVILAETALSGSRDRYAPRLLAQLHLRHAYALARLGDATACTSAIAKARTQVERIGGADDPRWVYWVSPGWVTVEAGDCLLQAGRPEHAVPLLAEGVALFDDSYVRDRQIYSLHLADALAQPGPLRDLDQAANHGTAALGPDEHLHSTVSAELLRNLQQQLRPHAQVASVRDFLDRARESTSPAEA